LALLKEPLGSTQPGVDIGLLAPIAASWKEGEWRCDPIEVLQTCPINLYLA